MFLSYMKNLFAPYLVVLAFIIVAGALGCYPSKPRYIFEQKPAPTPPDYNDLYYWAAHPMKSDSADVVPSPDLENNQEKALADVFFLHPTTYTGKWGQNKWNAPVDDEKLNEDTDDVTIKNQATIFNGCYRIFAPRYRQAHYQSYKWADKKPQSTGRAFDLAYQDVRNAFEYYLEHHNDGRPFVIAGHSQGTTHGIRLVKEFIDGKPLSEQFVAAYLLGMPVHSSTFEEIGSCQEEGDTGCINSWRTMKDGHYPSYHEDVDNSDVMCINPLSWRTDSLRVPAQEHKGMVLLNFYEGYDPGLSGTQVSDGILWIEKPCFPGSFLYVTPDYHQGDYNLFYMNVRENACHRLEHFLNP